MADFSDTNHFFMLSYLTCDSDNTFILIKHTTK